MILNHNTYSHALVQRIMPLWPASAWLFLFVQTGFLV